MTETSGRAARGRIGINVPRQPAAGAINLIRRAEAAGVATAWMTMSAVGADTPTLFAAAAVQTERIALGTAIVPAFTRHPLALATQAIVLGDLAPGRIRLGIGTSHGPTFGRAYGDDLGEPLERLREYVAVLRPALEEGKVGFAGRHYRVEATLFGKAPMPILLSALREGAFALAGEVSDGAISWLCPIDYLLARAKPALERGAARVGRPAPPLIAHTLVAFTGPGRDRAAIRAQAREIVAGYARLPFYARMFADAAYPLEADGGPSDALLDNLVAIGDDDALAERLTGLLDRGLDELLVMLLPGPDQTAEEQRLLAVIGRGVRG